MADFYLRDGAYLLLLAVSMGHELTVHDNRIAIPDPTSPGKFLPVKESDLDELEAHGLIETTGSGTEAGPVVSDRGRYWLKRWIEARFKVKGFRVTEVTMAKVSL